jgi:hypothetical protein
MQRTEFEAGGPRHEDLGIISHRHASDNAEPASHRLSLQAEEFFYYLSHLIIGASLHHRLRRVYKQKFL